LALVAIVVGWLGTFLALIAIVVAWWIYRSQQAGARQGILDAVSAGRMVTAWSRIPENGQGSAGTMT